MYPPYWGRMFWWLKHCSAKIYCIIYADKPLPEEISLKITSFLTSMCNYLPCPGCTFHCNANMMLFPPKFETATQYWQYTIDFHNRVNERNKHLIVTNEEALSYLNDMLKPYKLDTEHLQDAFVDYFWVAILITTYTFTKTPDSPTEEEQQKYKTFISDFCYIVPFGFKKTPDDKFVRDIMLENIDNLNLQTREKAFESLTTLHNSVCSYFQTFPKTLADMKKDFEKHFDAKATVDIARSSQIRDEDHKKMLSLQQEIIELKNGKESTTDLTSCDCSNYINATIALSVLLGVIFLLAIVAFIVYRSWKITRRSSSYNKMDAASREFEKLLKKK